MNNIKQAINDCINRLITSDQLIEILSNDFGNPLNTFFSLDIVRIAKQSNNIENAWLYLKKLHKQKLLGDFVCCDSNGFLEYKLGLVKIHSSSIDILINVFAVDDFYKIAPEVTMEMFVEQPKSIKLQNQFELSFWFGDYSSDENIVAPDVDLTLKVNEVAIQTIIKTIQLTNNND